MKEKRLTVQQNMLYNSVGSFFYLICQWLITVFVVHLSDFENAGILSLAMSISNMFFAIASFGIRSFQVSDLQDQYSASDYVRSRILTCLASLLACAGYLLISGQFTTLEIICVLLYMFFKLSEAIVDVFHGIDQKADRMDIIGVSSMIRGILSLAAFCLTLALTKQLILAIVAMSAVTYAVVLIYDTRYAYWLKSFSGKCDGKKILALLRECWPLMLNTFLLSSIVSIPRNNLEWICSATALGYYGSVATPAVIVQTASLWLFNPLIAPFTVHYQNKDKKNFLTLVLKVLLSLAAVFAGVILAAFALGNWALLFLFGEKIQPYTYLLIPVLITTMMIAISWFWGTLLVIMRKQKMLLLANAVAAAISIIFSPMLIRNYQMDGVNYVIYIAVGASLLLQTLALWFYANRHFAKSEQNRPAL